MNRYQPKGTWDENWLLSYFHPSLSSGQERVCDLVGRVCRCSGEAIALCLPVLACLLLSPWFDCSDGLYICAGGILPRYSQSGHPWATSPHGGDWHPVTEPTGTGGISGNRAEV